MLTRSGAQIDVVGDVVHKLHRAGTDPRALTARLRIAARLAASEPRVCSLRCATDPDPVGDRWRTRWPRVETVAQEPDRLPWAAAARLLATLHAESPHGPERRLPHGWPARLRRSVDRARLLGAGVVYAGGDGAARRGLAGRQRGPARGAGARRLAPRPARPSHAGLAVAAHRHRRPRRRRPRVGPRAAGRVLGGGADPGRGLGGVPRRLPGRRRRRGARRAGRPVAGARTVRPRRRRPRRRQPPRRRPAGGGLRPDAAR